VYYKNYRLGNGPPKREGFHIMATATVVDFPANATKGDTFTNAESVEFKFTGSAWRKVRNARPALELSTMDASIVKAEVVADRKRTRNTSARERKAQQKAIDGLVQKAYDAWVKAGKPSEWAKMPGANVKLPATQLDTLKSAVYAAGQYLDLRVRFGNVSIVDVDGTEIADVVFTASDKPVEAEDASANGDSAPADK